MIGTIGDIQWCPTADDLFLTWGSELSFYRAQTKDRKNEGISAVLDEGIANCV